MPVLGTKLMANNRALKFEKMHTQRGFSRVEFKDLYDTECSLQHSSLATLEAIWLGCDKVLEVDGKTINQRMHLSRRQARQLAKRLLRFAETGEIWYSIFMAGLVLSSISCERGYESSLITCQQSWSG